MDTKQKKKPKRTTQQVDKDLMCALERLIAERGFMNISVVELGKESDVSPTIIYRKYGTLDKLFEEFASKYDFWMNETLNLSDIRILGDRKFYANALKTLFRKLLENDVMQKVLIYEVSEDNSATRQAANIREKLNLGMMVYYEDIFRPVGIDINSITAWFIAGIYYLVLHKDRSTFCSVDFTTNEGKGRFCNAIDFLVDILFDKLEQNDKMKTAIIRMHNDGISQTKICEYFGITLYQLKKFIK